MEIAIPLYDRFTILDAIGPYEVLSRLPGARVRWVAGEQRAFATDRGARLVADAAFEQVPAPDVIVVPGGTGTIDQLEDERLVGWIRRAHETSTWTTSVCTGSLLLGAAGVLDGLRATSHFAYLERLTAWAGEVTRERVVIEGKVITSAGVSAGIDMALRLAAEIAGPLAAQAIQLAIEYDPQPPFDSGSTTKAPRDVLELVKGYLTLPAAS